MAQHRVPFILALSRTLEAVDAESIVALTQRFGLQKYGMGYITDVCFSFVWRRVTFACRLAGSSDQEAGADWLPWLLGNTGTPFDLCRCSIQTQVENDNNGCYFSKLRDEKTSTMTTSFSC